MGSISRYTMFMVIASTTNFNLLLGREWIHVVGAVPSTLHKNMSIWNDPDECQVIEADPTSFHTPDAKVFSADKIWVHVGPFKIEQRVDVKRQVNEKGEPLTMVLKPCVSQGRGTAEYELV